ncbi:hypothetical protein KC19_3G093000 [Ceratodon purpureus]|uniref:Uncharacterized protein n=1 Tax=Ceratodon purpureus TaxID=3225 RepID=A0A8T0IHV4_CERPU|nr:hypothetical protein KC19_3G093000 [Ceratodon purpureus]
MAHRETFHLQIPNSSQALDINPKHQANGANPLPHIDSSTLITVISPKPHHRMENPKESPLAETQDLIYSKESELRLSLSPEQPQPQAHPLNLTKTKKNSTKKRKTRKNSEKIQKNSEKFREKYSEILEVLETLEMEMRRNSWLSLGGDGCADAETHDVGQSVCKHAQAPIPKPVTRF